MVEVAEVAEQLPAGKAEEKTFRTLALDFAHAGRQIHEHGTVLFWSTGNGEGCDDPRSWHWQRIIANLDEIERYTAELRSKIGAGK